MKRTDLLNVLEKVKPGIATSSISENMAYFLFSGKNIITYNDKISIQHPFNTEFNLFVKANDIYKLLLKTTVEDISLSENNGKLNITSKKFKANLSTIKDDEIQSRINTVSKSLKKAKWKKLPSNFNKNVSLCSFSASKQESDQTLTCVYIDGVNCIASDNQKIAHSIFDKPMKTMFVKASEIKNLVATEPIEYSITKSWLHFRNEDKCVFSIRKIKGKFPDYLPFFDFKGTVVNLPQNMIEGMNITSIITDSLDPSVIIKIAKGFCTIIGESEAGKIQHRSKIKYNGKEISFRINPDFLIEMMTHSSTITLGKDKTKLQTENGFELLTALFE